ncbi:MAG: AMP-binding protein, partial [Bacteroidetes bacterium]|nr:AMP-binding protein [Bacteroidota bacterium]
MQTLKIQNNQYNIGYICTAQQCAEGRGNKVAMRWINSNLEKKDYTFNDLDKESNRFANVLKNMGFQKGDIFFTFLPKAPEQFFAFLGTLKIQAIAGTLFSNFGEESLLDRLGDSKAKGIITKKSLYKKVLRVREKLPELKTIIVTDIDEHISNDVLSYSKLMKDASDKFDVPITTAETPSALHYTSGSTGKPKGVLHLHKSVLLQNYTSKNILQLNENEIYWCTADQGWVTGTSYGIIGPWSIGVTQVHFGGTYDADTWMNLLEEEKISIWYTAPTALRMLMREDSSVFKKHNLQKLKYIFSVGEPLNPEIIYWSRDLLGR